MYCFLAQPDVYYYSILISIVIQELVSVLQIFCFARWSIAYFKKLL